MTVETRKRNYVQKEIQGDMLTPISVYHALNGRQKILFESSAKHEESGRYSFIAANPIQQLVSSNNHVTLTNAVGEVEQLTEGAFEAVKTLLPNEPTDYPFSFYGGAIGYVGYDTAFYHEKIGEFLEDPLNMPDMHLLFFDAFIVFDHLLQKLFVCAIDLFDKGLSDKVLQRKIDALIHDIERPVAYSVENDVAITFNATITEDEFIDIVLKGQEHIKNGDIFQIVLSQRFEAAFNGNPMSLYRKLRLSNPSPYMYFLQFDDYTILGTSPESLVKVNKRKVTTNPIAGTRPRGKNAMEDQRFADDLLQDEKELAEHRMLVDLGRNDIGRLSKVGTVEVPKYMEIDYYKYVMHIVSEVTGELRDDIHPIDVLKTTLPAGTVSGAPKIRAMQLINQFEKQKRGVYAGAVGYISVSGDLDMALAIRTMVVKDGKAYVQAGAGVVYNSVPKSEYQETLNKAKALLEVR